MSSLKLINTSNVLKCFTSKRKKISIPKIREVITFTQTLSLGDVNLTMVFLLLLDSYFNLIRQFYQQDVEVLFIETSKSCTTLCIITVFILF